MNKIQILGFVRHLLTSVGGYVAGRGWLTEDLATEAVGIVVAIVGFAWSYFSPEKKDA